MTKTIMILLPFVVFAGLFSGGSAAQTQLSCSEYRSEVTCKQHHGCKWRMVSVIRDNTLTHGLCVPERQNADSYSYVSAGSDYDYGGEDEGRGDDVDNIAPNEDNLSAEYDYEEAELPNNDVYVSANCVEYTQIQCFRAPGCEWKQFFPYGVCVFRGQDDDGSYLSLESEYEYKDKDHGKGEEVEHTGPNKVDVWAEYEYEEEELPNNDVYVSTDCIEYSARECFHAPGCEWKERFAFGFCDTKRQNADSYLSSENEHGYKDHGKRDDGKSDEVDLSAEYENEEENLPNTDVYVSTECFEEDTESKCHQLQGCEWIQSFAFGHCLPNDVNTIVDCYDENKESDCDQVPGCGWVLSYAFGDCVPQGQNDAYLSSKSVYVNKDHGKGEEVERTGPKVDLSAEYEYEEEELSNNDDYVSAGIGSNGPPRHVYLRASSNSGRND